MTGRMSSEPRLPRLFWLLWLGALINRLGDFVQPFLAIYLSTVRGMSPSGVGFVVSLWGLGALGAGPVGGVLADRIGRRKTLLVSTLLGSAGMLQMGLARAEWHIAVAACVLGFVGPLYRPVQQAVVADLVGPEQRPRAFALFYWAANLGFAFSAVVAGLLARRSFALLFVLDAVTTLGYGAVIWRFIPETKPGSKSDAQPARRSVLRDFVFPFRDPVLLVFFALNLLTFLSFAQAWCTAALEIRRHGISPEGYGRLMAINGLLIVALQLGAVKVVRRLAPSTTLALSSLLIGGGFGLYAWAHDAYGYAVGIVVWTLGEITWSPVGSSTVVGLAPVSRRGAYQGAFTWLFAVANCLGPLLGGLALQHLGATWLWAGCFGLGAVAAIGHLLSGPTLRRRLALAAAS
jgi:MFS family permease